MTKFTESELKKFDKQDKRLNDFKQKAFDLGVAMCSADVFRKETLQGHRMTSGDRAEIVMSFMLGFFKKLTELDDWGELRVTFSPFLDRKKVDFVLTRFGWDHKIQLKFNDLRKYILPRGVHLVRSAPSRKFRDKNFMGKTDRGDNVLLEFLVQGDAYSESELYDFFDEHEDFAAICCEVWEMIHD